MKSTGPGRPISRPINGNERIPTTSVPYCPCQACLPNYLSHRTIGSRTVVTPLRNSYPLGVLMLRNAWRLCIALTGGRRTLLSAATLLSLTLTCMGANANHLCQGTVQYLGVSGGGDLYVQLSGSTPVHAICNIGSQGGYSVTVPACRAAHGTFLVTKLAGKVMTIYYTDDSQTCATIPSWGVTPSVYFIQGPE